MKLLIVNGGPRLRGWNTAGHAGGGRQTVRGKPAPRSKPLTSMRLTLKAAGAALPASAWARAARCAAQDALTPVLNRILEADALLVGSPIYFGDVTGQTRSFFERLWFPGLSYDKARTVKYKKRIPVGLVFYHERTVGRAVRAAVFTARSYDETVLRPHGGSDRNGHAAI